MPVANTYFEFKHFRIEQDRCAMKVTTDACLFGAWVTNRLQCLQPRPSTLLDIGTGTGLLSLMIAQEITEPTITALELDPATAEQASENSAAAGQQPRITIIPTDARDWIAAHSDRFDAVVSNPPFYESELSSPDAGRDRAHHAGGLPLSALPALIKESLAPEGHFYLLLAEKGWNKFRLTLRQTGLHVHRVVAVRQTDRHQPFRMLLEGQHSERGIDALIQEELVIVDGRTGYSEPFRQPLRPYYLKC